MERLSANDTFEWAVKLDGVRMDTIVMDTTSERDEGEDARRTNKR